MLLTRATSHMGDKTLFVIWFDLIYKLFLYVQQLQNQLSVHHLEGPEILVDWRFWEQSTNTSSAKIHSVMSCKILAFMCASPAARCASLIVSMVFTIESCVREHHFSKEVSRPEVGEKLACLLTRGRRSKWHIRSWCKDWRRQEQFRLSTATIFV